MTSTASLAARRRRGRPTPGVRVTLVLAVLLSGCAFFPDGATSAADAAPAPAKTLRLGFFGNLTHAPALVAVGKGFLARELGSTAARTQIFNAGPSAVEALNAGAIDAAYLGPSPTINAYVRSRGETLRIVSGATTGGAQLVVRHGISSAEDLKGADLATPQLGGTQDIALRSWLTRHGLENSPRRDGDVTITPTENAQILGLFQAGTVDGAWVPEPWASRLVLEAGGKVLVDERALWPSGKFLTTHVVVTTDFLRAHPQTVEALVRANVAAVRWITAHPTDAPRLINTEIAKVSGKPLSEPVLSRSFANIGVDVDPLANTLPKLLEDAVAAGLARNASLRGIYDLRLLNKVLRQQSLPAVSAAGLGEE